MNARIVQYDWSAALQTLRCFRGNETQHKRAQSSRYLRIKDRAGILSTRKPEFPMANLADCFNVNRTTIYREICRKTARTASGDRKHHKTLGQFNWCHPNRTIAVKMAIYWVVPMPLCKKRWRNVTYDLMLGQHWGCVLVVPSNSTFIVYPSGGRFFTNGCMLLDESLEDHKSHCEKNFPWKFVSPVRKFSHPSKFLF